MSRLAPVEAPQLVNPVLVEFLRSNL
jgi:hypothetical protein